MSEKETIHMISDTGAVKFEAGGRKHREANDKMAKILETTGYRRCSQAEYSKMRKKQSREE